MVAFSNRFTAFSLARFSVSLSFWLLLLHIGTASAEEIPQEVKRLRSQINKTNDKDKEVLLRNQIAAYYLGYNLNKAIEEADLSLFIAQEHIFPEGVAEALKIKGKAYFGKGDDINAMQEFSRAYTIMDSLENDEGVADLAIAIGDTYTHLSNNPKARQYYLNALHIYESLGLQRDRAIALHKLGLTHFREDDFNQAANEIKLAINILDSLKDFGLLPRTLNSLGECYYHRGQYNLAIYQHEKAIIDSKKVNDLASEAYAMIKIAQNKMEQDQFDDQKANLDSALVIAEKLESEYLMIDAMLTLSRFHKLSESWNLSKTYVQRALDLLVDMFYQDRNPLYLREIIRSYELLYNISKRQEEFDAATKYQDVMLAFMDTLLKVEKADLIRTMELNQILENRDEVLSRKDNEKEAYKKVAELQQNSIEQFITFIAVFVLLVVTVIILQMRANIRNRVLNKELTEKNKEIETRSEELTEQYQEIRLQNERLNEANRKVALQNQVISDGLKSAQEIQNNLLPADEYLKELFSHHFLIYLPKEMVSGDFYWAGQVNGKKIIAVADCTGHGVSGALTSMFGINFLNQAVNEDHLDDPAAILTYIRSCFYRSLGHSKIRSAIGMEISICAIDEEAQVVKYCGVRSYLYYAMSFDCLNQVKGSRRSITKVKAEDEPCDYQNTEINYQNQPLMLYLATDGYKDQYGGPLSRERFGRRRMRELFGEIKLLGPEHQKRELLGNLKKWMGGAELQIDDILVMGLRLNPHLVRYKEESVLDTKVEYRNA